MRQRLLNWLIALDQLVYVTVTLGQGEPDETMSAAAWRCEQSRKVLGRIFRPVIDCIFWLEPQHCLRSFEAECERAQLPNEYRTGVPE